MFFVQNYKIIFTFYHFNGEISDISLFLCTFVPKSNKSTNTNSISNMTTKTKLYTKNYSEAQIYLRPGIYIKAGMLFMVGQ